MTNRNDCSRFCISVFTGFHANLYKFDFLQGNLKNVNVMFMRFEKKTSIDGSRRFVEVVATRQNQRYNECLIGKTLRGKNQV